MARKKDSDGTKKGIIMIATDLFVRNTYENTTIEDILKEWGGSKGSLYYHFKSKEDLLNAVVGALAEKEGRRIKEVLSNKECGALDMLAHFLTACLDRTPQLYGLEDEIYRSKNITLLYGTAKLYIEKSAALLEPIIRKGIEEGVFKTEYPADVVEFALIVEEFVFKYPMFECDSERYMRKVYAFQSVLEQMLGLEGGDLDQLSAFCQKIMDNQRRDPE